MTHTLHRRGTIDNLGNDYVIFAMSAKGVNDKGSAAKLRSFLRIAMRHNPVNMGDMRTGNMYQAALQEILERIGDTSIVHAVFTDPDTVTEMLREVKEADLGVSVVASGIFERVNGVRKLLGPRLHATLEFRIQSPYLLLGLLPLPGISHGPHEGSAMLLTAATAAGFRE